LSPNTARYVFVRVGPTVGDSPQAYEVHAFICQSLAFSGTAHSSAAATVQAYMYYSNVNHNANNNNGGGYN